MTKWREFADYILGRLGIALLVLWAAYATWNYAILFSENQQLRGVVVQQQAAYQQLQQQATELLSAKTH